VAVNVTAVSCNGTAITEDSGLPLWVSVIGASGNAITLEDIDLVLVLSGLESNSILEISGSSVTVVLNGANAVSQSVCSDSYVTVQAISDGSVKVVSSESDGPAVGSANGGNMIGVSLMNSLASAV
jgi:hypothetical protein